VSCWMEETFPRERARHDDTVRPYFQTCGTEVHFEAIRIDNNYSDQLISMFEAVANGCYSSTVTTTQRQSLLVQAQLLRMLTIFALFLKTQVVQVGIKTTRNFNEKVLCKKAELSCSES